ncbi:hypothetical protein ACIRN4_14150 [Pimelobacter simplex]|uniref:hypothetical protein n=1 Tax=Nocardioides simplex TaxID=2045 RepID=UPI0037FA6730
MDEPRWKDDGNVLVASVALPALSPVNAAGRGRYVEIEIHGRDAHSGIDRIGHALPALLAQLPELTVEAARLAPAHWRGDHDQKALWLMAIEP